jgi:uncharacterized membrane protein
MVSAHRDPRVPHDARARSRWAAVITASAVALALWMTRVAWVGAPRFDWLLWNLALAWIPWFAARGARQARSRAGAIACGGLWLLFLPNAPYLVTDLVHLRERLPIPLWFDVLLFAAFALAGCALGWAATEQVQHRLAGALGRGWAALTIMPIFPLVGFGVYLGRFGRWNSWDFVTRPRALFGGAITAVREPSALVFSAGFGLLIAAGYLVTNRYAEALAEGGRSDSRRAALARSTARTT